ncbi:MAG: hypothetical protein R2781_03655 [Flavobacteriaceae bacterium]
MSSHFLKKFEDYLLDKKVKVILSNATEGLPFYGMSRIIIGKKKFRLTVWL